MFENQLDKLGVSGSSPVPPIFAWWAVLHSPRMAACEVCGVENPEGAKFCLECGTQLAATAPERFRRTVTILFSDIVGSTALGERLDAETLSRVMGEYFAAVKPAVERHGGTLAKFIGDAVMAVFGLTRLHEDDALRAVRAAVEMQRALAELNRELERRYGLMLSARTGINTGPVAGEGLTPDRNFVAGDTANTAARLQSSAGAGEILLGEPTYRLVRAGVEAELLPPLELKGKLEAVTAYRLLAVAESAEGVPRRLDAPLIGRERELETLRQEFRRAVEEGRCRLVTLLGEAGVGKSRLVRELASAVRDEATVLQGRACRTGRGSRTGRSHRSCAGRRPSKTATRRRRHSTRSRRCSATPSWRSTSAGSWG